MLACGFLPNRPELNKTYIDMKNNRIDIHEGSNPKKLKK